MHTRIKGRKMNLLAILFSFTHKILENNVIGRCQKLTGIFSKNILIFKVLLHKIFEDIGKTYTS